MNLGVTSVAAPNAASSRTARYSSTARPAASRGRPAAPSTRARSLASAWIRLASMANHDESRSLCQGAVLPVRLLGHLASDDADRPAVHSALCPYVCGIDADGGFVGRLR